MAITKYTAQLRNATRWLVFVSLLSVVVLYFQYCTLSNTDRTIAAGQRAFVFVDKFEFTPDRFPDGSIQGWIATPIFENTGTTPTKNMLYISMPSIEQITQPTSNNLEGAQRRAEVPSVPRDPEDWFEFKKDDSYPFGPRHGFIGPKGAVAMVGGAGVPETYSHEKDRLKSYWVGVVHYFDTLPDSPERITKFCYSFTADVDPNKPPRSVPCLHWNCADDDCKADKTDYEKEMQNKGKVIPP